MDWKDKVVWVTGASSGIGEAFVKELANQGAQIILSARNQKEMEHVRSEAGLTSANSEIIAFDLADYKKLHKYVPIALKKWGRVDALINNGGISQRDLAVNTSLEVTEQIMNVNFYGAIALTIALYPHFRERKQGIIAVTSSIAGKVGTRLRSSYCASKHAIQGYYDSLRAEAYHDGIQVTVICPGFVNTRISYNALLGSGKSQNSQDAALANGLDVTDTAKKILKAIGDGKSELVIGGVREVFASYLKRFFPSLLSVLLRNAKVT
jgi:dehydrogenase/reductase SDR family protein 7B